MLSQCYNSDGSVSADEPCDPNALVSACCTQRSFCATNLFCLDDSGHRLTGTCTQQDWGQNALASCPCPGFIQNTPFDPLHNVTKCINGIYCCSAYNQECCNNGQGQLTVVYDSFAATATGVSSAIDSTLQALTTTNAALSNSSITSIIFSTTSPSINPATVPTSSLGNSNDTASGTDSHPGDGSFGQMGIGVALGLGTPLLLIFGACIFLFVRLRETRLQVTEVEGPMRAKRSLNSLRERRSMATLNEEDGRWI